MSVEQPDVIDGIGLEAAGEKVVMIISDHLAWDDPSHVHRLAAKIEAYAAVVLSGQLAVSYPESAEKSPVIRLIHQHLPDETALSFLKSTVIQLQLAGIGFEYMSLPTAR